MKLHRHKIDPRGWTLRAKRFSVSIYRHRSPGPRIGRSYGHFPFFRLFGWEVFMTWPDRNVKRPES